MNDTLEHLKNYLLKLKKTQTHMLVNNTARFAKVESKVLTAQSLTKPVSNLPPHTPNIKVQRPKPKEEKSKARPAEILPQKTHSIQVKEEQIQNMQSIKEDVLALYPKLLLYDEPLIDEIARRKKMEYQVILKTTKVIVLTSYQDPHHALIEKIGYAIDRLITPCQTLYIENLKRKNMLIEEVFQSKGIDSFFINEHSLTHQDIKEHVNHQPTKQSYSLFKLPIIPLNMSSSVITKEDKLAVWTTIQSTLQQPSTNRTTYV